MQNVAPEITIRQGETKPIRLELVDNDGDARDITGYTQILVNIAKSSASTATIALDSATAIAAGTMAVTQASGYVDIKHTGLHRLYRLPEHCLTAILWTIHLLYKVGVLLYFLFPNPARYPYWH